MCDTLPPYLSPPLCSLGQMETMCNSSESGSASELFPLSNNTCPNICSFDGLDRLRELGFETDWLWYDVLALVIMILFFQTMAYIALRVVKKKK